jgi:hypothetical protein
MSDNPLHSAWSLRTLSYVAIRLQLNLKAGLKLALLLIIMRMMPKALCQIHIFSAEASFALRFLPKLIPACTACVGLAKCLNSC